MQHYAATLGCHAGLLLGVSHNESQMKQLPQALLPANTLWREASGRISIKL